MRITGDYSLWQRKWYEERLSVVMEKCWHRHLLKMDQRSEIILMAECLHML